MYSTNRKLNTPAQDRIRKLVNKKKLTARPFKEMVSINPSNKISTAQAIKFSVGNIRDKEPHTVTKSAKHHVDFKQIVQEFKNNNMIGNHAVVESLALFKSKNVAEDRLRKLKQELTTNQSVNGNDEDCVMDARANIEAIDEEMEWDPYNESMDVDDADVLLDFTYIIPDTNVFIDSLELIKSLAEKGLVLLSNFALIAIYIFFIFIFIWFSYTCRS